MQNAHHMPNLTAISHHAHRMLRASTLAVWLLVVGCEQQELVLPDWRKGELLVMVSQSAPNADQQFEQDIAKLFAEYVHARLKIIPAELAKIPEKMLRHQAHFAAAGWRSNEAIAGLKFGPSYQTLIEQLVFNKNQAMPHKLSDLIDKRIAVATSTSQEAVLREAQRIEPLLKWQSRTRQNVDALLAEVADDTLDYTLANQEQLALAQNFYPDLAGTKLALATPSKLAWMFAADSDAGLFNEATAFFALIKKDGTLGRLLDRYYGYNERLEPIDAAAFISEINITLPRYRALFKDAAHWSGIEWQLLAAIAYQESHWNPLATSPTNVRGMMMLTEETADRMNVTNRLDVRQSIQAGAQYLVVLKNQLPLRIAEPDRTWMALAAYNQGLGHLEDARILTQRMGMNPDYWADVKKWMPLLKQPEYFDQLKHGYARGGEAVILVENIRMYYNMLERINTDDKPLGALLDSDYQLIEHVKRIGGKLFHLSSGAD